MAFRVRDRLRRPSVRVRSLTTLVLFACAGLLFTASAFTAQGTDLRRDEVASITDLVRARTYELAVLQERVRTQQQKVDALAKAQNVPGLVQARADLAKLAPRQGFAAMSGPAVRVDLNDAPASMHNNPDVNPDDLVVHQQDVQAVVNAMWRGRARAITVMGQRIIATSAVKCVGNTLLLQGRVYSPPYRIVAVGNTKQITRSILDDSDVQVYRDYAGAVGLGWHVQALKKYTAPAFGALPIPVHAIQGTR
ncbi:MAG: DUF881 domain-containing protein [Actinobacteria bacterium]|nr:DUF881 domain-containing protein [Actinomycetota bacterium]